MSKRFVIAGGGLAGSLMAVYLARRGHEVTVLERRPDLRRDDAPAGRSINLALARRGIAALRGAGVMDRVQPLLTEMRGRMLHDGAGELEFQAYGNKPGEVIYSVSRSELNRRLLDAAEQTSRVTLRFQQRVDDVDFAARRLTVTSEPDGEVQTIAADHLIAADGAGSPVRRALTAHLGIEASEEFLAHGYKELTIPAGEAGSWQMEPHALHIWPRGGYMLIALPNLDGTFTVTLFLPFEGEPSFAALGDDAGRVESLFREQFPDALALIPDLAETFARNPTGHLGTVRCPRWRAGDFALLLGDAAHAIVPFHGQGMNCAFEDCRELDRCLSRHEGDLEGAFAAFEAARRPNAEAIADMALENYVEMRDSVRDPGFKLRKELGWKLEERHPDRFIPRYSMVMFHSVSYADAKARGEVQAEILRVLTEGAERLDDVDLQRADRLIRDRLAPVDESGA